MNGCRQCFSWHICSMACSAPGSRVTGAVKLKKRSAKSLQRRQPNRRADVDNSTAGQRQKLSTLPMPGRSDAFEVTPEGLKRTEVADRDSAKPLRNQAWIYLIILAAALSVCLFFIGRYHAPNEPVTSG